MKFGICYSWENSHIHTHVTVYVWNGINSIYHVDLWTLYSGHFRRLSQYQMAWNWEKSLESLWRSMLLVGWCEQIWLAYKHWFQGKPAAHEQHNDQDADETKAQNGHQKNLISNEWTKNASWMSKGASLWCNHIYNNSWILWIWNAHIIDSGWSLMCCPFLFSYQKANISAPMLMLMLIIVMKRD